MKRAFNRDGRSEVEKIIDAELLRLAKEIQEEKNFSDCDTEHQTDELQKKLDYRKLKLNDLEQLIELVGTRRKNDSEKKSKVSPDVMVGGAINLLGIGVILCSEQIGKIITSKAFGLIRRV